MDSTFDGFTLQLDSAGNISLSSDTFEILSPEDQEDILKEAKDVIMSLAPKRVHKVYGGHFLSIMIAPFYSSKTKLEGFTVAGFPIPFTLFDNVVVDNIVDFAYYMLMQDEKFIVGGVNNNLNKVTGFTVSEVIGKPLNEFIFDREIEKVEQKFREAWETKSKIRWEERLNFKIGFRYFEMAISPVLNTKGGCHALIGTVHDITEMKIAQEEMAKNYSLMNEVMESTTDAVFVKNLEGQFQFVNSSAAQILGMSKFELLEKRDVELFSDQSARAFVTSDRLTLEDGNQRVIEESCSIKGKDYRFHSVKGAYRDENGKLAGTYTIARDITNLKKTEDELKHSNSLLRATLNATADGILVLDNNRRVMMFNRKFLELWKIDTQFVESNTYEQILIKVLGQLQNPEECLNRLEEIQLDPSKDSYDIIKFKDGRVFERYTIPQFVNGDIVGRVFSYRDIGPRTSAQAREEQDPLFH